VQNPAETAGLYSRPVSGRFQPDDSQSISNVTDRFRPNVMKSLRREDHYNPPTLHLRRLLELGDIGQLFRQTLDEFVAFVGMRVFAAAEDDGEDNFILLGQELFGAVDLGHQVVVANLGTNAELFVLAVMRVAFMLPLLLLVLEFAEVHDAANRRLLLRRDFYEVEAEVFGTLQGFGSFEYAELITFVTDDANGRVTDLFVDPLRFTVEGDGTISKWVLLSVGGRLSVMTRTERISKGARPQTVAYL
jgi:hypothetical protein